MEKTAAMPWSRATAEIWVPQEARPCRSTSRRASRTFGGVKGIPEGSWEKGLVAAGYALWAINTSIGKQTLIWSAASCTMQPCGLPRGRKSSTKWP